MQHKKARRGRELGTEGIKIEVVVRRHVWTKEHKEKQKREEQRRKETAPRTFTELDLRQKGHSKHIKIPRKSFIGETPEMRKVTDVTRTKTSIMVENDHFGSLLMGISISPPIMLWAQVAARDL